MEGSSRIYSTPISPLPIWVARRIRWASPPDSVAAARDKVRAAVEETDGQVLVYGGELIEAAYFSSTGGSTARCRSVLTAMAMLVGPQAESSMRSISGVFAAS